MHVCMYMYTHTHVHVDVHTYTHICIYAYMRMHGNFHQTSGAPNMNPEDRTPPVRTPKMRPPKQQYLFVIYAWKYAAFKLHASPI